MASSRVSNTSRIGGKVAMVELGGSFTNPFQSHRVTAGGTLQSVSTVTYGGSESLRSPAMTKADLNFKGDLYNFLLDNTFSFKIKWTNRSKGSSSKYLTKIKSYIFELSWDDDYPMVLVKQDLELIFKDYNVSDLEPLADFLEDKSTRKKYRMLKTLESHF